MPSSLDHLIRQTLADAARLNLSSIAQIVRAAEAVLRAAPQATPAEAVNAVASVIERDSIAALERSAR